MESQTPTLTGCAFAHFRSCVGLELDQHRGKRAFKVPRVRLTELKDQFVQEIVSKA